MVPNTKEKDLEKDFLEEKKPRNREL